MADNNTADGNRVASVHNNSNLNPTSGNPSFNRNNDLNTNVTNTSQLQLAPEGQYSFSAAPYPINGSFFYAPKDLQQPGGGKANASMDQRPSGMVLRSFAYPLKDEEALGREARQTLGHDFGSSSEDEEVLMQVIPNNTFTNNYSFLGNNTFTRNMANSFVANPNASLSRPPGAATPASGGAPLMIPPGATLVTADHLPITSVTVNATVPPGTGPTVPPPPPPQQQRQYYPEEGGGDAGGPPRGETSLFQPPNAALMNNTFYMPGSTMMSPTGEVYVFRYNIRTTTKPHHFMQTPRPGIESMISMDNLVVVPPPPTEEEKKKQEEKAKEEAEAEAEAKAKEEEHAHASSSRSSSSHSNDSHYSNRHGKRDRHKDDAAFHKAADDDADAAEKKRKEEKRKKDKERKEKRDKRVLDVIHAILDDRKNKDKSKKKDDGKVEVVLHPTAATAPPPAAAAGPTPTTATTAGASPAPDEAAATPAAPHTGLPARHSLTNPNNNSMTDRTAMEPYADVDHAEQGNQLPSALVTSAADGKDNDETKRVRFVDSEDVAFHAPSVSRTNSVEAMPPKDVVPGAEFTAYEEVPTDPTVHVNSTYLKLGCFHTTPIKSEDVLLEEVIVDSFNDLSCETRRLEVLEAFYVAHMAPYENNGEYTADNWDVLDGRKVNHWFRITFDNERYCFYVTLFKREFRFFMFSYLFRGFCIFVFWVIMFCMLNGKYFSPGTLYFDTLSTILFAGLVGTLGAYVVQVPTIVGVIWAGILWNNAPYVGRLTSGINTDMRQFISTLGLAIGVLRAGLSLNVIRFKQKFKHYMLFAIVPACTEMVVHGLVCHALFHYDSYKLAFAEGFLTSCIAPSVIVPTIIAYQKRGYGVRDGPPMMILCSIAFDTALCIWGIQFLLALEFKRMSTPLLILLAPLQVIIGFVGGILLGVVVFLATFCVLFMEGERLPAIRNDRKMTLRHSVHVRYFSIIFMVLICFCEMAVGKRFNCLGGGAVGVVSTAGTFNFLCVRGGTRDHLRVKADMAQSLTTIWDYIAMPALFGLSGAAVNVHQLFARDFIGLAFALVFIGIGVRFLAAVSVPIATRLGLTWKELLFVGCGWVGKGSIQGALGSTCMQFAADALKKATTPAEVAWATQRQKDGIKMKNVAILSVLVACPICSIFLTRFTGKLLRPGT